MGASDTQAAATTGNKNFKKILMRNIKRMREMGLRIEDVPVPPNFR